MNVCDACGGSGPLIEILGGYHICSDCRFTFDTLVDEDFKRILDHQKAHKQAIEAQQKAASSRQRPLTFNEDGEVYF